MPYIVSYWTYYIYTVYNILYDIVYYMPLYSFLWTYYIYKVYNILYDILYIIYNDHH